MRGLILAGALLGFGLGSQMACGGACADTGSHNCCAGSHCTCAGAHCNCLDDPELHKCLASPADFECSVTWVDAQGEELAVEAYLYENFDSALGVQDTCNALQANNPDRPDEAVAGICSCAQIDFGGPAQLQSPS